jgi:hypothetical protein
MTVDAGLRQLFRTHLPTVDFSSIETGTTSRGIPDINYCCRGVEGWIEAKAASHWRIKFQTGQVGWIERRLDHGGRVFIATRRARDELWMHSGVMARRLVDERLDEVPSYSHWGGGPARWDWATILKILTE